MYTPEEVTERLIKRLASEETDEYLRTDVEQYVNLSVHDLRQVCVANHSHPLATVLGNSVATHPENNRVNVGRLDLLGLLHNREVHTYREDSGKQVKQLGKTYPTGNVVDSSKLESLQSVTAPDEEPQLGSTSE